MKRMTSSRARAASRLGLAGLTLGLMLRAPGAARADAVYKMQSILKIGDTVNGFAIPPDNVFFLGPLNDSGQLVFDLGTDSGIRPERLLQYENGQFTPVSGPGVDSPAGQFPANSAYYIPVGMNQRGDVVFVAATTLSGLPFGTFLWDHQTHQLTAAALPGMPATGNLTFADGGGIMPAINNLGDIVFPAAVLNAAGKPSDGLFFQARGGNLEAVALPDQELPGGVKVGQVVSPSLNDAGMVAFLTSPTAASAFHTPTDTGAYLWYQGTATPMVLPGMAAPGGGQFQAVAWPQVNNANSTVLLAASVKGGKGPWGLYRFAGGPPGVASLLTPLVVPGQVMPGGGQLKDMLPGYLSPANEAGQHVFEALLADDSQAAYRLDPDGTLTLILKSGMTTDLGLFTRFADLNLKDNNVSAGISLNSKGQIALVTANGSDPDTLVLLTPTTP